MVRLIKSLVKPNPKPNPNPKDLSLFTDRSFATIRIIKGGVHDFRGLSAISNFLFIVIVFIVKLNNPERNPSPVRRMEITF